MSADGLPLFVEELPASGAGGDQTFVLLHGYGGSSFSWRYWPPWLARRGRVLAGAEARRRPLRPGRPGRPGAHPDPPARA